MGLMPFVLAGTFTSHQLGRVLIQLAESDAAGDGRRFASSNRRPNTPVGIGELKEFLTPSSRRLKNFQKLCFLSGDQELLGNRTGRPP